MNKAVYTLVDKIEHQLSITQVLLAELHTALGEQPEATKSVPCSWCDDETYMTCPECGGTRFVKETN